MLLKCNFPSYNFDFKCSRERKKNCELHSVSARLKNMLKLVREKIFNFTVQHLSTNRIHFTETTILRIIYFSVAYYESSRTMEYIL